MNIGISDSEKIIEWIKFVEKSRLFEFQVKFLTQISFCVHVKDGNDNYTVQLDMFTGNGFFIISQFENLKVSHNQILRML